MTGPAGHADLLRPDGSAMARAAAGEAMIALAGRSVAPRGATPGDPETAGRRTGVDRARPEGKP